MGSRKSKVDKVNNIPVFEDKLYRADITDINGNYLAMSFWKCGEWEWTLGAKSFQVLSWLNEWQ